MNRPTTRTEQVLASASKGVSSRLILAEAGRFVEPGEIFVVGLIQDSYGRLASPKPLHCSRVWVLTGVYQTSVPRRSFRTVWYRVRIVGHSVVENEFRSVRIETHAPSPHLSTFRPFH